MPIADVIYSLPYEAFIGRDTKGGFVGRETIDGIECAHLGYTDKLVDVQNLDSLVGPTAAATGGVGLQAGPGRAQGPHRLHELGPRAADCRRGVSFQPGETPRQVAFEQLVASMLSMESPTGVADPHR